MELRARHRVSAVIPTASITDISFLLVIYFIVTMVHPKDTTEMVLPASALRFDLPAITSFISIDRDGRIRTSLPLHCGLAGTDDSFDLTAASFKAHYPDRPLILRADEAVPYHHVDRVLDSLRRARIDTVYFQTRQKLTEKAPADPEPRR